MKIETLINLTLIGSSIFALNRSLDSPEINTNFFDKLNQNVSQNFDIQKYYRNTSLRRTQDLYLVSIEEINRCYLTPFDILVGFYEENPEISDEYLEELDCTTLETIPKRKTLYI